MGLESSSELFTISVNGVLYLQVRGTGSGTGGTTWARLGGCSGSLGTVPSDSRPGRDRGRTGELTRVRAEQSLPPAPGTAALLLSPLCSDLPGIPQRTGAPCRDRWQEGMEVGSVPSG